MNQKQFDKIVLARVEGIKNVLVEKAKEYSSKEDRLHNFKVAARLESSNQTPEQALWGMAKKHLVSIIDIISKTPSGEFPSDELRDEKIGDSINYLILLEALLIERKETTEPAKKVVDATNASLVYKHGRLVEPSE